MKNVKNRFMTCYHHLLYGDTGDKRDYKELYGVKGAYKRLKGVIKGDRGLQRVKEDYRWLEWVTKVLQEVARGLGDYDGLQEREQKLFLGVFCIKQKFKKSQISNLFEKSAIQSLFENDVFIVQKDLFFI